MGWGYEVNTRSSSSYVGLGTFLTCAITFITMMSLVGIWQRMKRQDAWELSAWIGEAKAIIDPYERYIELGRLAARVPIERVGDVYAAKNDALIEATCARNPAALTLVERGVFERIVGDYADAYDACPRDSALRKRQVDALAVLWPNIGTMPVLSRVDLLVMATRCHLHIAADPTSREVYTCLNAAAHSLHWEHLLTPLMDSASYSEPLVDM